MNAHRISNSRFSTFSLRAVGTSFLVLCLAAICHGQYSGPPTTTWPAVDQFAYFDSFLYDDGTRNPDGSVKGDYWWNVGQTNPSVGNPAYVYQDAHGGHSTVEYDPVAGILVLWTITLGSGGTLYYMDGAASGHLGSFVLQSSDPSLNKVINISGVSYAPQSGNLLSSTLNTFPYDTNPDEYPDLLWTFTYKGTNYSQLSTTYDYTYRSITQWTGGVTTISSSSDLQHFTEQMAIGLPNNGGVAKYIGLNGVDYIYRPNSTASNALTKLNGYSLASNGNKRSLPQTSIRSFVWNENLYTLDAPCWIDYGQGASPQYWLYDGYSSSSAYQWIGGSQFSINDYCAAYIKPDGTFGGLILNDSSTADGFGEDDASLTGGPVNFTQSGVFNNSSFTFINNNPYLTRGNAVTLVTPVANFTYANQTYQPSTTTVGANNTFVTQYTSSSGTATMIWSQATNQLVSMTIKPTTGGTATYANGDAVGRPGAYVLSATSTLANALTQVNSSSFTPSGDAALPSGGYVNSNGVFDVQGNFMSLGQWSNDNSHVGFSLSYDDGTPVTTPATIEFTSGRTLNTWLWDSATSDGTGVNMSMQLDQNSRLMLYPPTSSASGAPAVPTPSIVLDPNPGGMSRFDGPVRISRQGDLQMGEFISEPTPTPAQ